MPSLIHQILVECSSNRDAWIKSCNVVGISYTESPILQTQLLRDQYIFFVKAKGVEFW